MPDSTTNELVLVLGGARSGKSSWALQYTEDHYHHYLFLATARVLDEEMAQRVCLHKDSRGPAWHLLEEPVGIAAALREECRGFEAVLIDCLTVWLSNILLEKGEQGIERYRGGLLETLASRSNTIIIVSNEVGMGIVPETPLGRTFRDVAGETNQKVAALADKVVLMTAGLPLYLKGTP